MTLQSLVNGVTLGAVVGAIFGAWNLIFTWLAPLAEDTPIALAGFYGPMFVILVASMIGAGSGLIGGFLASVGGQNTRALPSR